MCDTFCRSCFFFSATPNTVQQGVCDYLLITASIRPCKSGEGCTEWQKKTEKGKYQSVNERRRMWVKGAFLG